MTHGDGDGWAGCDLDHRHWGRHGAAGLLACAPDDTGRMLVLLIRRARWSHHGGTWGPPGGARDSHESPVQAAVREAAEECGAPAGAVRLQALVNDDHGSWSYQTLIAGAAVPFPVRPLSREATHARWVPERELASLPLHPGFAAVWPLARTALEPVTLIVDGANVMGSRPDGWWQDRAGAMVRLHSQLTALAATGIAGLPPVTGRAGHGPPAAGRAEGSRPAAGQIVMDRWFPRLVLVAEGRSRAALSQVPAAGQVRMVAAPGEGDDMIAALSASEPGRRFVVTADQRLRERCEAAGAAVTGPRWLTQLLT